MFLIALVSSSIYIVSIFVRRVFFLVLVLSFVESLECGIAHTKFEASIIENHRVEDAKEIHYSPFYTHWVDLEVKTNLRDFVDA